MDVVTKREYEDKIANYKRLITEVEAEDGLDAYYAVNLYRECLDELTDEFEWLQTDEGWKHYQEHINNRFS